MLLIAAGSLWLFLAAVPTLADGGPHVASENSGVSSLTADSCAGCHRVHTAQGAMLLKVPEEQLCLSCHGDAVVGATTNVESGLQYSVDNDDSAVLGALRSGGFEETHIGNPFRYNVGTSRLSKVEVSATPAVVTSAHLTEANGLVQPGVAWGNGANGSGAGPAATIGCASCHNPHGNGQYRILNPVPAGTGINAAWTKPIVDFGVITATDVYRTQSSHGLLNGDTVTIAGNSNPAANVAGTVTVLTDTTFRLAPANTSTASGTGGTVTRNGGVRVTDDVANLAVTRNYTVIQTAPAAPTLTATAAAAYDPTDGDYFHYKVPWNGTSGTNLDAPNGIPVGNASAGGFSEQMTAWCASCHTRYFAWSEPTEDPDDGATTGAAYANPRPGDSIFTYQHRTRGASGRSCTTCHVSHGSSAIMDGQYSSTYTFPDGTVSANSRLLKVGNRGTCQLCHDPTGTAKNGDQFPPAPYPIPAVP